MAHRNSVKSPTPPAHEVSRGKPAPVGSRRIPKMCLHRASGQAVVRLGGRDYYLGRWKSVEAQAAYHRRIAEWIAADPLIVGAQAPPTSLAELAQAYWGHCLRTYRRDGRPTPELANQRAVLRRFLSLYADEPVEAFGPLALQVLRQAWIGEDLARSTINADIGRVRRLFRWAAANELIDARLYQRLMTVEGLRLGRGGREPRKRRAVPWRDLRALKPHLRPQVWRMALMQYLTGMRSGELVALRGAGLDRSGRVWIWRPDHHKTEASGVIRQVAIGPLAQRVLKPLVRQDPAEPIFQAREAVADLMAERRAARRLPRWPSHDPARRRKRGRKLRRPGATYSVDAYRRAIVRACAAAGIEVWTPHELRHSCATRVRARFGLDAARAVLGHAGAGVTLEYAHLDLKKAVEAAAAIG